VPCGSPLHELLGIASTLDIPPYFSRDLENLSPNLSPNLSLLCKKKVKSQDIP